MYIEKLKKGLKEIDKKALNTMNNGIKFSFVMCLIAIFILAIYSSIGDPNIFYIGISLFKSSLFYIVACIICGYAFSKIIKDINK